MPHIPNIPDLGLKPTGPPADASNRAKARVRHPRMYRFGRAIGWILVLTIILACVVLSIASVTALTHLYWRLTDAVWRLT